MKSVHLIRIFSFFLAFSFLISLCACNMSKPSDSPDASMIDTSDNENSREESTPPSGDHSTDSSGTSPDDEDVPGTDKPIGSIVPVPDDVPDDEEVPVVDEKTDPALTAIPFRAEAVGGQETVAGGYKIDMGDLPQIYLAEHPEWVQLYNASWHMNKTHIQRIPAAVNPGTPYYIDEAFTDNIFVWDTLFMMLFDKYGIHQFPVLSSLDNFYFCQTDSSGEDNGYIPREIKEKTGEDYWDGYLDENATNPPLFSWAEWELYQIHGDISRFSKIIEGKTIYQRLVAHYQFIETNKKMPNGLYGKTTGLGTGLDNTPNQGSGQTHNSLSIQQAQNAYYLAKIAKAMGNTKDAAFYEQEHTRISDLINKKMWNGSTQMYSNLTISGDFTDVSTPTTLWSLIAKVATKDRAASLISHHALNSQKMFRPNGLATLSYDHREYVAQGGYWHGGLWAPTSYQYIKGLEAYGYNTVAFEESVRHIQALSDVYQAGFKADYVPMATLWETYSSEYLRQGYMQDDREASHSNFAGWTPCLTVGLMLENLIGLKINAPENQITWTANLTEENGVSNLYYVNDGKVNRVSLAAGARNSASAPMTFTVKAERAFRLRVNAAGTSAIYEIAAGTHTYRIGTGDEGKHASLGVVSRPLAGNTALVNSSVAASAKDYIYFTDTKNTSILDGITCQAGRRSGLIYNVNTVGRSQAFAAGSLTHSASPDMAGLGYAGAVKLTRSYFAAGNEGFMLCAKATNSLQTLRLVVEVDSSAGILSAALSDASASQVTLKVSNGTYVIDIPFTASSVNRYLLVKWTVDNEAAKSGSVSLLGAFLVEGGIELPSVPTEPKLTRGDGQFVVNAASSDGNPYDSWKILVTDDTGRNVTYKVPSLPYTISKQQNDRAYTVKVIGIKGGYESAESKGKVIIPRKPYTDYSKIEADTVRLDREVLHLTESGAVDWVQFSTDDERYAQKKGGTAIYGYRRNHTASPNGEKGRVLDAPVYYTYSDCESGTTTPVNMSGVQTRGEGNGFSFFLRDTGKAQTLYLYTGVWSASARLEFIVNGRVQYTTNHQGSGMNVYRTKISYKTANPDDVVEIRLTLTDSGGGSALLLAAALDSAY